MFKPGWKDIFRMNQNELESEIRNVSRDPTLDPRRKAYLIQNLMTRFVLEEDISIFLFQKSNVTPVYQSCITVCQWLLQSLDSGSAEVTSSYERRRY